MRAYKQRLNKIGFDTLYQFYITENKSISSIAILLNCNAESVRQKLHRFGITVRPRSSPKHNITRETLEQEYTKNKKTYAQLAVMFNCGETLIYNLIHKYGIQARSKYGNNKGRKFNIAHREKLSQTKQGKWIGSKNPCWKGGVTTNNTIIRRNAQYAAFRTKVLRFQGHICSQCGKNLNEKCQCCGHKPDKHVHHIKEFANNDDTRFTLSNAIVLCETCHKIQHKK